MCKKLLVAVAFSAAVVAEAQTTLTGTVIDVIEGDSVLVLATDGSRHRVRIAGVDAPERGQPGFFRSKESLAALVYERPVSVEGQARDQLDRLVGRLRVAPLDATCRAEAGCPMSVDVGLAQIRSGRAWRSAADANTMSPDDALRYERAEQDARRQKLGLWRSGTAVPPWAWRRQHHR